MARGDQQANINGRNTLLGEVYVQRQVGVTASSEEIRESLNTRYPNALNLSKNLMLCR